MNHFENLITFHGENKERRRLLKVVFDGKLPAAGEGPVQRRGFSAFNGLTSIDWPIPCASIEWEPPMERIVVHSRGDHVAELLIAASKCYQLAFRLSAIDVDENAEDLAFAPESAEWLEFLIQDGVCRSV